MSMSVKMKMQMASMMGKSVMKNVIRDFGRDRRLVLCLSVCSIVRDSIRFFTFLRFYVDFIQFFLSLSQNVSNMNNHDITGRIRWIDWDLTSSI